MMTVSTYWLSVVNYIYFIVWDHCDTNDTHYITPTSTSKYASTSAEQIKTTSTISKVSKPIIGIETPVLCKEPYKFPYICFKQKLMHDDKREFVRLINVL